MMNLAQRAVDGVKPGERRFVWDEKLKGFGLRITEGSVAYICDFRFGAKRRRVVLGSTSVMSFVQARDRAQEILYAASRGQDLTVDARKCMPTFKSIWNDMMVLDRLKLATSTVEDYQDRAERLILPDLGEKLIGEVTEAQCERVIAKVNGARNKGYVTALIKKAINHAKKDRILPPNHHNPASSITIKKQPKKGRAIEEEDIRAFGKALSDMETEGAVSPWLANLFRLSLICGLRPGEVRTLKWVNVNIPKCKMNVVGKTGAREIHITDAAKIVLEATPKVQGCEFVFAGRRFGEPLVAVYKGLAAVQRRAGIERFRLYDLRHSAATAALAGGADVRAVQALLGHADLATTSIYLHSSDTRKKAAAEHAARFGRGVLRIVKDE